MCRCLSHSPHQLCERHLCRINLFVSSVVNSVIKMVIQSCIKADTHLQLVFILIRTIYVAVLVIMIKCCLSELLLHQYLQNVAGENKHDRPPNTDWEAFKGIWITIQQTAASEITEFTSLISWEIILIPEPKQQQGLALITLVDKLQSDLYFMRFYNVWTSCQNCQSGCKSWKTNI